MIAVSTTANPCEVALFTLDCCHLPIPVQNRRFTDFLSKKRCGSTDSLCPVRGGILLRPMTEFGHFPG